MDLDGEASSPSISQNFLSICVRNYLLDEQRALVYGSGTSQQNFCAKLRRYSTTLSGRLSFEGYPKRSALYIPKEHQRQCA